MRLALQRSVLGALLGSWDSYGLVITTGYRIGSVRRAHAMVMVREAMRLTAASANLAPHLPQPQPPQRFVSVRRHNVQSSSICMHDMRRRRALWAPQLPSFPAADLATRGAKAALDGAAAWLRRGVGVYKRA